MRIDLWRGACALVLAGLIGCGAPKPPADPPVVVADPAPAKPEADPAGNAEKGRAAVAEPSGAVTAYTFPDDSAGRMLGKLLTPADPAALPPPAPQTRGERPIPSAVERPTVLPPVPTIPPRLPVLPTPAVQPTPPPERVPADLARATPDLPGRVELPVGGGLRLASPDPRQPTPLPPLAKPVVDRAALDDPTADYSTRSVTGARLPIRGTRAPFVKVNLPEPFEHAAAVRLRLDVVEDPNQALGSPPPPKP